MAQCCKRQPWTGGGTLNITFQFQLPAEKSLKKITYRMGQKRFDTFDGNVCCISGVVDFVFAQSFCSTAAVRPDWKCYSAGEAGWRADGREAVAAGRGRGSPHRRRDRPQTLQFQMIYPLSATVFSGAGRPALKLGETVKSFARTGCLILFKFHYLLIGTAFGWEWKE